jgi:hypothetical protein
MLLLCRLNLPQTQQGGSDCRDELMSIDLIKFSFSYSVMYSLYKCHERLHETKSPYFNETQALIQMRKTAASFVNFIPTSDYIALASTFFYE